MINKTKDTGLRYALRSPRPYQCKTHSQYLHDHSSNVLHLLLHTALLQIIHTNQWFLSSPATSYSKSAHAASTARYHNKIKEIMLLVFNVIVAWGVPDEITRDKPLAGDWESFNKGDNRGEVVQGMGVLGVVNFAKL